MKVYTMVELDRELLRKTQYPIIVETLNHGLQGRLKRAYDLEFTPEERVKCRKFYNLCYNWTVRDGTPNSYSMRRENYLLFLRLISFCANN